MKTENNFLTAQKHTMVCQFANGSVSKSDTELDSQRTATTQNAIMIGSTDIEIPKNSLLGINFLQTV